MRISFILVMLILFLATGCSTNNDITSNEQWSYKEGFVVAKENDRILVVRRVTNIETPLSDILEEAQPNAIWLSVDKSDYDSVSVGDQVSINIANGAIDQSYPAQAAADVIKK